MRIQRTSRRLPRNWRGLPLGRLILAETDVRVSAESRLRLKVLVFINARELRRFWSRNLGSDPGWQTNAVVHDLGREVLELKGPMQEHYLQVDPLYFSVMGLTIGRMGIQIICHESVHAAFNYRRRTRYHTYWPDQKENSDEAVCYPAGRIAQSIWIWLCEKQLNVL